MSASDDDSPQLSAHSLAALTEFLQEQAELAQNEERGNTMPQEDWVRMCVTGDVYHLMY